MNWFRRRQPAGASATRPGSDLPAAARDDDLQLPRHALIWEHLDTGARWSCSCGDGGSDRPGSTVEQQIQNHNLLTTAGLLPRLSPRQLADALRRNAADLARAQQVAVDLLIDHEAWLVDKRFRTFLYGGWSPLGELNARVDWRRIAYALSIVDEMLYDLKLLGAPAWMQPRLERWPGIPEHPPLFSAPEYSRSDTAVLRVGAAIAGAASLDLNLASCEVDRRTRAVIARALERCITGAR